MIPYSRGALDIARQVKAETGSDRPLSELEAEIETMITAWKTEAYSTAWAYLERCAEAVESPGYLQNPFGRYRFFTQCDRDDIMSAQKREAQNFRIQSTVADAVEIGMQLLVEYRANTNLQFRMANQIHDAIKLQVREEEIDETKQALNETLGNVKIPIGSGCLKLGIDITIMDRWGQKRKVKK